VTMSFEPPRGRGRCPEPDCGYFICLQGHRPGCRRSWCRRCRRFAKQPGGQLCAWCAAADDDARQDIRREAVAERMAEMDDDR
jgi:hypothetical protein